MITPDKWDAIIMVFCAELQQACLAYHFTPGQICKGGGSSIQLAQARSWLIHGTLQQVKQYHKVGLTDTDLSNLIGLDRTSIIRIRQDERRKRRHKED